MGINNLWSHVNILFHNNLLPYGFSINCWSCLNQLLYWRLRNGDFLISSFPCTLAGIFLCKRASSNQSFHPLSVTTDFWIFFVFRMLQSITVMYIYFGHSNCLEFCQWESLYAGSFWYDPISLYQVLTFWYKNIILESLGEWNLPFPQGVLASFREYLNGIF